MTSLPFSTFKCHGLRERREDHSLQCIRPVQDHRRCRACRRQELRENSHQRLMLYPAYAVQDSRQLFTHGPFVCRAKSTEARPKTRSGQDAKSNPNLRDRPTTSMRAALVRFKRLLNVKWVSFHTSFCFQRCTSAPHTLRGPVLGTAE